MKTQPRKQKKIEREIIEIISQYLNLKRYKVFFFGSRVSGRGTDRSDIDVGIEGPEPVPLEIMARIRDAISELKTLYSIDVVDFACANEDFKRVAKEYIEIISPKR